MLIDKYLSVYHFNELHSIEVKGLVSDIYQKMLRCDFSKSLLIKFLFRLRGMPKNGFSVEHLTNIGFIKLEEIPGEEIIFGMVTNNPMFNTCRSDVSSKEFSQLSNGNIIKAVINFKREAISHKVHIISTETRVWCGSESLKSKFKYYWFFIKPFSQIIRKSMLKQIRAQVLQQTEPF